jgi:hypothetical protein
MHKISNCARHSSSLPFLLDIIWGDFSLGTKMTAGTKSISKQNTQVALTQIYTCLQNIPQHVEERMCHGYI